MAPETRQRIISIAWLVPILMVPFYLGGIYAQILWAIIALLVVWEWGSLIYKGISWAPLRILFFAFGTAFYGLGLYQLWTIADSLFPFTLVVSMFLFVLLVDTTSYFVGRHFGGPKLASFVSPWKTWSGFVGGILAAAIVPIVVVASSLLRWKYVNFSEAFEAAFFLLEVAFFLLMMPIFIQLGDIFKSKARSLAGVEDSRRLIPGQDILDRLDGFLAFNVFLLLSNWYISWRLIG